jgi:hypothetical protein
MGNICPPNKNHSANGLNGRSAAYLTSNEPGYKVNGLVSGGNGNVIDSNQQNNNNNSSYPIVNIGNGNVQYGNNQSNNNNSNHHQQLLNHINGLHSTSSISNNTNNNNNNMINQSPSSIALNNLKQPMPIPFPNELVLEKPNYIALFDYEQATTDDMTIKKNDPLIVMNKNHPDWWLAKNLRTKQTGYVPYNYITSIDDLQIKE